MLLYWWSKVLYQRMQQYSRFVVCTGCGQKFVAKSSVYVHLKKHDKAEKRGENGATDWSDKEITYHCPMETCDKRYNSKAKLRSHILKHFPETMKPEDAAQIDIVPLLQNGIGAKETIVEPSTVTVKSKIENLCFYQARVKATLPFSTTVSNTKNTCLNTVLQELFRYWWLSKSHSILDKICFLCSHSMYLHVKFSTLLDDNLLLVLIF